MAKFEAERFVPVPNVTYIKEVMLKNAAARETLPWGSADFRALSPKQLDALHTVLSSLLFSEANGNEVCGNLVNRIPYRDISDAFAVQILDESHHTALLTRYFAEEMRRPVLRAPLVARFAVRYLSRMRDPLVCALAASHFVECAAAEVQHELVTRTEEPMIVAIFRSILRDEARHNALGREASRFLLDTPIYRAGWRRERARVYRRLVEWYSKFTFDQYREVADAFGVDLKRMYRRTLEKVDQAVPL